MLLKIKLTTKDKTIITKVDYDGEEVIIITKKTSNKNAYLRVDSKGQINFSRPKSMKDKAATKFVNDNLHKLVKAAVSMVESKPYNLKEQWVDILGVKTSIDFKPGRGYKVNPTYITMKGSNTEKAFKNFVKSYSECLITRAKELAAIEGLDPSFTVRDMKSKWGVCYTQQNRIVLSTRLIHYRQEVIDYVILHELCHLYVPNHSQKYWNEVSKRCPNYKELKKELKRW